MELTWGLAALPYIVAAAVVVIFFRPSRVPAYKLQGKHVLITGGSSGIGLALGAACRRLGARVSLVARSSAKLEAAKRQIEAACAGPDVSIASADVTKHADVVRAEAQLVQAQGPVDVLISAAGMSTPGYALDQDVSLFGQQMELNYMGTVHAVKAVVPGMLRDASCTKRIVLIGSGASTIGFIGYAAYCPTKFAVRGFADVLRNELCGSNVRVHMAYPPDTDTAGFEEENKTKPQENKDMFPLDLYKPELVVRALRCAAAAWPEADPTHRGGRTGKHTHQGAHQSGSAVPPAVAGRGAEPSREHHGGLHSAVVRARGCAHGALRRVH